MSELLDAFDDEGLTDPETRLFLVEALLNAEQADWQDILEPFVQPDRALAVLNSVPGVLDRSVKALQVAAVEEEKVSASSRSFLDAFQQGVLQFAGLHTLARCARTCRECRDTTSQVKYWMHQIDIMCSRWKLSRPVDDNKTWRDKYFLPVRPRCDGIYVGECSFKRWLRLGHHLDMRKNGAALAAYGGRGGHEEVVQYRRYVRLLPPEQEKSTGWVFILQDPCPRSFAEDVLVSGVDPTQHVNPADSELEFNEKDREPSSHSRLRKRICVGTYIFAHDSVHIRYQAGEADFRIQMKLSHRGPRRFANCLEWSHYIRMDDRQGEIEFNLGKLPEWKGGGLADEDKDHFPDMLFRPKNSLEHLC